MTGDSAKPGGGLHQMLVVGQAAKHRRGAEEGQAVAGEEERSEHLRIEEAAAVEQGHDEIGVRPLPEGIVAVGGGDQEAGHLQGLQHLVMIDGVGAVLRMRHAARKRVLGEEEEDETVLVLVEQPQRSLAARYQFHVRLLPVVHR